MPVKVHKLTYSLPKFKFDEIPGIIAELEAIRAAFPPAPVTPFFVANFPAVAVDSAGNIAADPIWSSGNQDTASTTIENGELVCRTHQSLGADVGARAFFSGLRWDRFTPYEGQTVRFTVTFRTPFTTIQQGGFWSVFQCKHDPAGQAGTQVNIDENFTFWLGTPYTGQHVHRNPAMRVLRPDTPETFTLDVTFARHPALGKAVLRFDGERVEADAYTLGADAKAGIAACSYTNGAESTEVHFSEVTAGVVAG